MFTEKDQLQIENHGLRRETVETQIANFNSGFPFLKIIRAASPADGIFVASDDDIAEAVARYQSEVDGLRVVKFVPASGAATRMFKELFEFVNDNKRGAGIDKLIENIEKFAFWSELKPLLPEAADDKTIVEHIVKKGLGYGDSPKGLVTFHNYPEGGRKAVEEHLAEGADYASSDGVAYIHFTVSTEHLERFKELLSVKVPLFEAKYNIRYQISFSTQKSSTDTIAVNPDLTPFRTDDGSLLFRPAGHGALIENLNDIDADIIFIKNIDNVTTDALRGDTTIYKKALAGHLLNLQYNSSEYLQALEVDGAELDVIAEFVERKLCVKLPSNYTTEMLKSILERATHFNPVDLVCGVVSAKGAKFDLREFVDETTGFISSKSSGGRDLLAQELPGLWNGAMARWNTIFMDVPISTFSPVKVVQDLLREQHQ